MIVSLATSFLYNKAHGLCLYALENLSWVFLYEPEHLACTYLLQIWNQPRKKRLSPKKSVNLILQ